MKLQHYLENALYFNVLYLQEVDSWANQGPNNSQAKNSKLERAVQNLRTEINKLQSPPNLANLNSALSTPQQTPKL